MTAGERVPGLSADRETGRGTSQGTDRSADRGTGQGTSQGTGRSADRGTGQGTSQGTDRSAGWGARTRDVLRRMRKQWELYVLLLAPVVITLIFKYVPMVGLLIAFKNYNPVQGIFGSEWVGLKYFRQFFSSPYALQTIGNTLGLSLYGLAMFWAPIVFALAINELRDSWFKKTSQMIAYAPNFISTVVIVGMMMVFLHDRGPVNTLIDRLGGEKISFLGDPGLFKTVYVFSDLWQGLGFSSIIYLAALAGIDPQLHEAAKIDGASRFRRIIHINIPGIVPTMVILLILASGSMMSVAFEKVFLMQNPVNISSSEVISTMVYKVGLLGGDFSYSTAVGFFNSVVNLILIVAVNGIARRVSEHSLW